MEAEVLRRYAIGPFPSADRVRSALPDGVELAGPSRGRDDMEHDFDPHVLVEAADGIWLSTLDPEVRDLAAAALEGRQTIVTIDCWNSFAEEATVARLRVERHRGGQVDTEWADRRHSDLARAGVLGAVMSDWLA